MDERQLERMANALLSSGQSDAAVQLLATMASTGQATAAILKAYARGLRDLERNDACREVWRRVIALEPGNAVAEHNLAALLGDMGLAAASEAAARQALAKGGQAPETWLVLGRALQAQLQNSEAEAAFREAILRRPAYLDAHRDLAQLLWMQTESVEAALRSLNAIIAGSASTAGLVALRAGILNDIAGPDASYSSLTDGLDRGIFQLELAAAQAAVAFDPVLALRHADAACAVAPFELSAMLTRAVSLLACGRASEALTQLEPVLATGPENQHALALQRTAWRMTGDARALSADDYSRLVRSYAITCPPGWASLPLFLADLRRALVRLHGFSGAPLGQSIRSGAQAAIDPRRAGDPAIDAAFEAFVAPITAYLSSTAEVTSAADLRRSASWDMVGAWSVRLRAGGRHIDHVHPQGWISSAFYVDLPEAGDDDDRAGWLRFGAPGIGDGQAMGPEYWVKPEPGHLVLFPSYFWHGTQPFEARGDRLTIAFDLRPGWNGSGAGA